ncbi:hypothetical protein U1Q18_026839 [Sarracenia purpurea var. burkii]
MISQSLLMESTPSRSKTPTKGTASSQGQSIPPGTDRQYHRGRGAGIRCNDEGVPWRHQSNTRSPNQVNTAESSGCASSIFVVPIPPSSLDLNLAYLSGNNRISGFLSMAHPMFLLNVRIKRSKLNATDHRTLRPPIRKRRNQMLRELALIEQGVEKQLLNDQASPAQPPLPIIDRWTSSDNGSRMEP